MQRPFPSVSGTPCWPASFSRRFAWTRAPAERWNRVISVVISHSWRVLEPLAHGRKGTGRFLAARQNTMPLPPGSVPFPPVFCATAPTIFNHTLHGIKHPSNWPFVFISSSNFRRSKLSCKFFFYDVVSVKLPILYYFWKVKTEKIPIFLVDGKFSFVSLEILECFFLLRDFFL